MNYSGIILEHSWLIHAHTASESGSRAWQIPFSPRQEKRGLETAALCTSHLLSLRSKHSAGPFFWNMGLKKRSEMPAASWPRRNNTAPKGREREREFALGRKPGSKVFSLSKHLLDWLRFSFSPCLQISGWLRCTPAASFVTCYAQKRTIQAISAWGSRGIPLATRPSVPTRVHKHAQPLGCCSARWWQSALGHRFPPWFITNIKLERNSSVFVNFSPKCHPATPRVCYHSVFFFITGACRVTACSQWGVTKKSPCWGGPRAGVGT